MKIESFITSPIGTNTYLVSENGRGILIDVGSDGEDLYLYALKEGISIEAVLLTHGHFDHANGCAELQQKGIKIYVHEADADKLYTYKGMAAFAGVKLNAFKADEYVTDGEILHFIGKEIKVIHTPGHSKGSVCYVIDDAVFCGDTLFCGSYGRYDFYDGDLKELKNSAQKIFALKGDYKLYPGHGEASTLEEERRKNPINFE